MADQHLTRHGAQVISHMGEFYGGSERYGRFLSALGTQAAEAGSNCDAMFLYANDEVRTVQTAEAFIQGLAPSCTRKLRPAVAGSESLFNQGGFQTSRCGPANQDVIEALLGGPADNFKAWNDAWRYVIADIQALVKCCPDEKLCVGNATGKCTMFDIPTRFSGQYWEALTGPTHVAKFFAEYFYLAAMNNMTIALGQRELSDVVRWHQLNDAVLEVSNNQWSAKSYASTLAAHILASLEQASRGIHIPGLLHGPHAKFVYMAGHDMNILMLKHLLGLTWLLDGWPRDAPVLGGMLIFELHRSGLHADSVRTFYEAASPSQIRNASRFRDGMSKPSRAPVAVPGCPALDCPLEIFRNVVSNALQVECIHDEDLRRFVVEGAQQGAPDLGLDTAALPDSVGRRGTKVTDLTCLAFLLILMSGALVRVCRCGSSRETLSPLLGSAA